MKLLLSLLVFSFLTACSVGNLPNNLSRSMMNQEDPEVVAAGAPAYLLLLDALILTYPDDEEFLLAGARLYGAYAGVFAEDESQAKLMANKAMDYARRALCEYDDDLCLATEGQLDELTTLLNDEYDEDDVPVVYAFASAWAGWIQANSDDWNAIAQVGKVKAMMQWVVGYEPDYDNATVQVYLGVLETQLPPSLGGKPEVGRNYFEQALAYTNDRHLMAKVLFAKQYARLLFDQELHDRLLQETLDADPEMEGLTLINTLAQRQAAELLAESAEYFE
ncbi:TRAP transporter TatT component family protein [Bacterioplanoides sp. SCSIO 12839]|uniref:TRAP transporter TatT component family protein n=1 Tax=Bacterioplanoides sp. SCSIO 12839 TaxID=2829569 RepID=UPI00210644A3|nr:TRAP transporter TatT component family protein [Bacterioplanoides sp. SCSIO 12839]